MACSVLFGSDDDLATADAGPTNYIVIPPDTWLNALGLCRDMNGQLLKVGANTPVTTKAEISLVLEVGLTWIGLSDVEQEGLFQWANGEDLTPNSEEWGDGQPEAAGPEADVQDCVVMDEDFIWQDKSCSEIHPAICEVR